MGTGSWDPKCGFDSKLAYSSVILGDTRAYFEMHRKLAIPKDKVHWLSAALTSRATFRARVPEFLRTWPVRSKRFRATVGGAFGLGELANLIDSKAFIDEGKWRFAITPIPWDLKGTEASTYYLEIRLIIGITRKQCVALSGHLTKGGPAPKNFFDVIDDIVTANKDISGFLGGVFPAQFRPK